MWGGGCVCYHDKKKTPDRNDLKLGTVVVRDTMSKYIDFGYTESASLPFLSCRRTHDEEPLLLPMFIHNDDVVRRRGFAFPQSAQSSSCYCTDVVGF